MKKIILIILFFCLFSGAAYSQQRETLIGDDDVSHGGFGGPLMKYGGVKGEPMVFVGGKGAWLINHSFYLGGGGFGGYSEIDGTRYGLAYSGPIIGYIGLPNQPVHFTFELMIGDGDIVDIDAITNDTITIGDSIIVIEPTLYISVNLARYSTVNLGLSYRYVSGSEDTALKDTDLSGVAAELSIMFGRF